MYTVRIYGDDPQAGPDALLSEHEFARDFTWMLEVMAAALADGCAVTLEAAV